MKFFTPILFTILAASLILGIVKYNDKINTPQQNNSSEKSGKIKHKISKNDQILLAVGDIGFCDYNNDELVAKLIKDLPGTIALLGDTAYENGTWEEFMNCFDPAWGELKSRIRPAVGNHEYHAPNRDAWPYFKYFGNAAGKYGKGYYSYNLGSWHLIALNSQICSVDENCESSEQANWLKKDLETNKNKCTIAYMHHPLFSAGANRGEPAILPLWRTLYENGVDIVLAGHDHNYERFSPMTPEGKLDKNFGIRSFVVGTGGLLTGFGAPALNSEAQDNTSYGILKLALHEDTYEWEFVPVEGNTFKDKGEGRCHGIPQNSYLEYLKRAKINLKP